MGWHDVIGIPGAALIVIIYVHLQAGQIAGDSLVYCFVIMNQSLQ